MDEQQRAKLINAFETVLAADHPAALWELVQTTYPALLAALTTVTAERDRYRAAIYTAWRACDEASSRAEQRAALHTLWTALDDPSLTPGADGTAAGVG